MISENKIQEHIAQYKSIQAPSSLQERIVYIPNAVELIGGKKENSITKSWAKPFKVIYVGRGSEEKRISEIISVAKKATENKLPFEFEIIGDVAEYIPADASNYVTLAGMINDKEILNAKYLAAHFIILLSSTEGMPLVILEAMQNGCIPIVTEVGDLPLVINNENGFLVQNNNLSVIQETFDNLVRISQLPTMQLELISNNARTLVSEKYSLAHFNVNYQQLLGI
jgi:glycosyltransferase involved in cell wall biosynthesis